MSNDQQYKVVTKRVIVDPASWIYGHKSHWLYGDLCGKASMVQEVGLLRGVELPRKRSHVRCMIDDSKTADDDERLTVADFRMER